VGRHTYLVWSRHGQRVGQEDRYIRRPMRAPGDLSFASAAQNEVAIKNLKLGMLIANLLSILLRAVFRKKMLTSTTSIILYGLFFTPTFFISRHLSIMGRPKRDAVGALISPGEDINQSGLTEYAFDVIYVTCESFFNLQLIRKLIVLQGHVRSSQACSVTDSGGYILSSVQVLCLAHARCAHGNSQIPGFAMFKLWNSVISPMVLGRGSSSSKPAEDGIEMQNMSKRQEKLRKRQEKGDPRAQSKTVRR
jgi:hypothetical protein